MTDILRLLLIVFLLTISLTAYFLVIGAFFSARLEKIQRVINQMPARAFWVGLVNFIFFGTITFVLVMLTNGDNRVDNIVRVILLFPTVTVLAFLGILLSFGLAGVAKVLGERIFPGDDMLKQNAKGTIALSIACALPYAGWFLLLPFVGLVGIGATILSFFQRN
jgi:bacteriorhodopsin